MTFKFIPLPLYTLMIIFACSYLIYNAITRRKIDKKGLLIIYYDTAIGLSLTIIDRLSSEVWLLPKRFNTYFFIAYCVAIAITLITITYLTCTSGKPELKKWLILTWISIMNKGIFCGTGCI